MYFFSVGPPSISLHLEDAAVLEGEDATFTCGVTDEKLQQSPQWYFNGSLLDVSHTMYNETIITSGFIGELGSNYIAMLTVRNVSLEDAGIYTCVAVNQHGNASSESHLYVQGK